MTRRSESPTPHEGVGLSPSHRTETRVCASPECDEEFEWSTRSAIQTYCSRRCMLRARRLRLGPRKYEGPDQIAVRRRAAFRRRGYGITPEAFDARVAELGSRCEICQTVATLVPDHDHATSTYRGAICTPCNHMLGKAYDDPSTLRAAAAYLER